MGESGERVKELDYLGGKIYQAKELIGRLREANKALTSRLEDRATAEQPVREEVSPSSDPDTEALVAEVARLRDERREIRERVSRLLQQLESLEA